MSSLLQCAISVPPTVSERFVFVEPDKSFAMTGEIGWPSNQLCWHIQWIATDLYATNAIEERISQIKRAQLATAARPLGTALSTLLSRDTLDCMQSVLTAPEGDEGVGWMGGWPRPWIAIGHFPVVDHPGYATCRTAFGWLGVRLSSGTFVSLLIWRSVSYWITGTFFVFIVMQIVRRLRITARRRKGRCEICNYAMSARMRVCSECGRVR
jgi:hypothetical protein